MTSRWKRISLRTARPLACCDAAKQAGAAVKSGIAIGQAVQPAQGISDMRVRGQRSAAPAVIALVARCLQRESE